MSEKRLHIARAKLIMGIIIPVLVMVVTATMIGISFAWFTQGDTEVKITAIQLTTEPSFTLTFETSSTEIVPYAGQVAFDGEGHLITKDWALYADGRNLIEGSTDYNNYMKDAPYTYSAPLRLDTDNAEVSMDIDISELIISVTDTDDGGNSIYDERKHLGGENGDPTDIDYGFTWYFINTTTNIVYTPYGSFSQGTAYPWESLPQKQGLTSFRASITDIWTFNIVFAPERLYWLQYVKAPEGASNTIDWTDNIYNTDVYTVEERANIVDEENGYGKQLYYSSPLYIGVDFVFSATINVTEVNRDTGGETV